MVVPHSVSVKNNEKKREFGAFEALCESIHIECSQRSSCDRFYKSLIEVGRLMKSPTWLKNSMCPTNLRSIRIGGALDSEINESA